MKTKDVVVGETYAVTRYGDHCSPMRAIETGKFTRSVWPSRSFHSHSVTSSGVRMQPLKDDLTPIQKQTKVKGLTVQAMGAEVKMGEDEVILSDVDPEWVLPVKVRSTWSEHVGIRTAAQDQAKALDAALRTIEEAAKERGVNLRFSRSSYGMQGAGYATVSADTVRQLMGLA